MNRRERRKQRITLNRAAEATRTEAVPEIATPAPESVATGPVTPEGKAVSSRNAVKHSLCSTRLTGADLEEWNAVYSALDNEWEPDTQTERLLLEQMALSQWRMNRALALELDVLSAGSLDPARLALILRYRTAAERNFYKALSELQRLRSNMRRDREREAHAGELRVARQIEQYIMGPFASPAQFVSQESPVSQKSFVSQTPPSHPPEPVRSQNRHSPQGLSPLI